MTLSDHGGIAGKNEAGKWPASESAAQADVDVDVDLAR